MIFGYKKQKKLQPIVLSSSREQAVKSRELKVPRVVSLLTLSLLVLLICSVVLVKYSYKKYEGVLKESDTIRTQAEVTLVIAHVSRLLDVPQDEVPLVARVSDPTLLPNDPFFKTAKSGDRILVYCKAQKSILYAPDRDKLIGLYPQALPGVCQ